MAAPPPYGGAADSYYSSGQQQPYYPPQQAYQPAPTASQSAALQAQQAYAPPRVPYASHPNTHHDPYNAEMHPIHTIPTVSESTSQLPSPPSGPQFYLPEQYRAPGQNSTLPQRPPQQQQQQASQAQRQQQGYQQANYNYDGPGYDNNPNNEKQSFEQAFAIAPEHEGGKGGPKWNDLWAAILFLAVFAGYTALSGWVLKGYDLTTSSSSNSDTNGLGRLVIVLFAYVLAVAFVISLAYLALVRYATKQIIWITGILQILVGLGTGAFYIWAGAYGAGIVFLIFAVFYIICFISWIPRIPFSVLLLQTIIDVSKRYGHVFTVSLIGGIVATAFGAWWSITIVAIYARYTPGNASCAVDGGCSTARVVGLIAFVTFAGYWITEVLKNLIHVTIAGVYGSWYFCAGKPAGFPSGSTRGSFRRAATYSFGSISFGSLIVAIVQLLRQACNIAKQNEQAQGNLLGTIFFWVLGCFIGLLDWLIQFFNEYAFCYIALYGKAYVPAAKVSFHPFSLVGRWYEVREQC